MMFTSIPLSDRFTLTTIKEVSLFLDAFYINVEHAFEFKYPAFRYYWSSM